MCSAGNAVSVVQIGARELAVGIIYVARLSDKSRMFVTFMAMNVTDFMTCLTVDPMLVVGA